MEKIKVIFTAVFTAFFSTLGILAIPVALLVGANIFDYITALSAAESRGQNIRSVLSIQGISKKVHMYMLIIMGAALDLLLKYTLGALNLKISFMSGLNLHFLVATIITVWLLFNEMISILENMVDAGTRLPPFLMPILQRIKGELEDKTKIEIEK